ENISPEELIERMHAEHLEDFEDFALSFDNFSSTHTETNRALVERIWSALKERGAVRTETIEQYYDTEREMFLPDRFIRGTCPSCGAEEQYGDSCEACSATYDPTELIEPRSVVSGSTPVMRKTEHYFVTLSQFSDSLYECMLSCALHNVVSNRHSDSFADGLLYFDVNLD